MFIRAAITTKDARRAGYGCGMNGANTTNCHYSLFSTLDNTAAWEAGKREAEAIKAAAEREAHMDCYQYGKI